MKLTNKIGLYKGPDTPCAFLICCVVEKDGKEIIDNTGKLAAAADDLYSADELKELEANRPDFALTSYTKLVQLDYDWPGLAASFGWNIRQVKGPLGGACDHDSTDGTIDCGCGIKAGEFISAARAFLDQCVADGTTVEDPGYLTE